MHDGFYCKRNDRATGTVPPLAEERKKSLGKRRGRGLSSAAFRGVDWEKFDLDIDGHGVRVPAKGKGAPGRRALQGRGKRTVAAFRGVDWEKFDGMRIPPPPAAVPSSALLHLPPAAQRLVTFTREAFSENRSKPDSIGGGKWNHIEPDRWGEEESDRGDGFHACVETSEANPYSDDARARVFADLFMA